MPSYDTSARKQLYETQGYIVVPALISPSLLVELEAACARTIAKTREGTWPHRRTVGRQFPPYDDSSPDSWGVQHVMHPDLGESAFARWYTSDELVGVVCELMGCGQEDLQMELFNILINPTEHSFALRWHRDDVRETATEDEEREALGVWHHGVQWNTALRKDTCLYIVPGSHRFPRTPAQRMQSSTLDPPANPLEMPGAIRVTLHPGETVFYNNNILHCAAYDQHEERVTLHACMGEVRGGPSRARNILQHGLGWMKEERFKETLNERGRRMLERIVRLQESVGEVGYSLANE